MLILETERLRLRTWKDEDLFFLIKMNQDPRVMEYFPSLIGPKETELFVKKIEEHFKRKGYSLYAVERKDQGAFIGFIGFLDTQFQAPFTPATEIGWQLSFEHWNQGFATDGAKALIEYGFSHLMLKEIVSFTTAQNIRSIRVMEKLGMRRDLKGDFHHPKIDHASPLSKHLLYRLKTKSF